jgi:hypothetical protein
MDIAAPQIVIVADGDSASAQANARGHLFEKFIAKLFEAYGCDQPRSSNLNVRNNGYELDISTQITLSRTPAIAECKAYSSPLPVAALSTFYGKLCAERLDNSKLLGWFVAIPGLTSDGHQLARKLESKDGEFRLVTAVSIYELAVNKHWIPKISNHLDILMSDNGILVTETGVAAIAKQLDPTTRLPTSVLVRYSSGILSEKDRSLLSNTDYAASLPIVDTGTTAALSIPTQPTDSPTLVSVVGSSQDFEYQFPAAPRFFVGRKEILASLQNLMADRTASGRVIVLNAQSGWGKSSLALRLAEVVHKSGGHAVVFDTRTATSAQYVSAALRKATTEAAEKNVLTISQDSSFASIQSTLQTLQSAQWGPNSSLLVFFDQFENVFRDTKITQTFRDLALAVRELTCPILIGFSWKTDLVALTENYPYRLRDEIRGAAKVFNIEPFGPGEVGTLLGRLAKAAGMRLSPDLRQRLREYSQGLPWLLKKLASHILTQLQAGTSEGTLLEESLNIERLFQQDLANLEPSETDALKLIAREAPVAVVDIVEKVSPEVIQALVDQRLLVRVGEQLDIYWDIFREFLVTGNVAVEDTYILRQRPLGTSKVLQQIISAGGEALASDIAAALSTSPNVVFNATRDLRQLGVLAPKPGSLALVEQLRGDKAKEPQFQDRVAKALRRHTVYSTIQRLVQRSSTQEITIDDLAKALPSVFPAMEAAPNTWRAYAIAFATWLDYSNLVQLRGQILCSPQTASRQRLLGGGEAGRQKTFPQSSAPLALGYLAGLASSPSISLSSSAVQKVRNDWQILGVIDEATEAVNGDLAADILNPSSKLSTLRRLLSLVPGGKSALDFLGENPGARADDVGAILRDAYGLPWVNTTTRIAGSKFRKWASEAGIKIDKVKRRATRDNSQKI